MKLAAQGQQVYLESIVSTVSGTITNFNGDISSKTVLSQEAFDVQSEILVSYRQDFAKCAPRADKRILDQVMSSCTAGN